MVSSGSSVSTSWEDVSTSLTAWQSLETEDAIGRSQGLNLGSEGATTCGELAVGFFGFFRREKTGGQLWTSRGPRLPRDCRRDALEACGGERSSRGGGRAGPVGRCPRGAGVGNLWRCSLEEPKAKKMQQRLERRRRRGGGECQLRLLLSLSSSISSLIKKHRQVLPIESAGFARPLSIALKTRASHRGKSCSPTRRRGRLQQSTLTEAARCLVELRTEQRTRVARSS